MKKTQHNTDISVDEKSLQMALVILRLQRKFSVWLGNQFNPLPAKRKFLIAIILLLAVSGTLIAVACYPGRAAQEQTGKFYPRHIGMASGDLTAPSGKPNTIDPLTKIK